MISERHYIYIMHFCWRERVRKGTNKPIYSYTVQINFNSKPWRNITIFSNSLLRDGGPMAPNRRDCFQQYQKHFPYLQKTAHPFTWTTLRPGQVTTWYPGMAPQELRYFLRCTLTNCKLSTKSPKLIPNCYFTLRIDCPASSPLISVPPGPIP